MLKVDWVRNSSVEHFSSEKADLSKLKICVEVYLSLIKLLPGKFLGWNFWSKPVTDCETDALCVVLAGFVSEIWETKVYAPVTGKAEFGTWVTHNPRRFPNHLTNECPGQVSL